MSSNAETYQRQKQRDGKVSLATKVFQAVGAVPESLKTFAFGTFVLLFYNQILGANALLVSLCLAAALTIDAAFDPIIGSFSDGLRTRLGRRHLLMYLSAAPIGLGLFLVFSPPHGLADAGLYAWLFATVILTNISMSLFVVPWTALFAEFTDDYVERTAIVTWRYIVGWVVPTAFTFATYALIFPNTRAHPVGQLNPAGYALFGPVVALATVAAILATTELTRREIPYLLQPTKPRTPRFLAGAGLERHRLNPQQPRLPHPLFGRALVRGGGRRDRHALDLHGNLLLGTDLRSAAVVQPDDHRRGGSLRLAGLRRPSVRQADRAGWPALPSSSSSAWA